MIYLPDQLMAVSLELRQAGGKVTDNTVMVGDEFEVELWVDSRDKILSGAAVFISFDPQHFELIQNDKGYLDVLKPFLPGNFLTNGEIFRNYLLDELDPAASTAGIQIDYSVVRATDQGAGALAKFGLRAISPTTSSEIKIDEMGSRETRFFLPDGNQDYFRYIKPLEMKVQGISLNNFPNKIVLRRSETQNINLRSYFFDPVFAIEDIEWNISPSNDIPAILDHKNHTLTFTAPQDHSPWQTIVITAKNPEGQIGLDTLNIFVNDPPIFESIDKITISEDNNFHIDLNSIISDVDTEWTRLEWSSIAGSKVDIQLDDEKQRATIWPEQNWYGTDLVRLIATDNFSFSDTLQLEIEIEPINDPPTLLFAPNIQLIPGRSDQSIKIENLIDDSEDNYSELGLTWSGEENAQLSVIDGLLTISSKPGWYGTEEIQLRVEDTEGKYSTGLLTVTISPTMPPTTLEIPSRIFISAGKEEIIDLNNWVTDPDDDDGMLTWEITGNQSVSFQINSQKMGLINSPRE
ncbi:hypothetical protein MK131_17780, partial [Candidatus Poribacteria bacterium]|nr:hypothetical protein [Candidatus Poribacteria bacterium]